jgi:Zn-dependent metalloprotease
MKLKRPLIFMVLLNVILFCLIWVSVSGLQADESAKNIYRPSSIAQESIQTWQSFNEKYQNRWNIEWNKITGTPHRISGYYINIPETLTKENISAVSRNLLNTHQKMLQIQPGTLVLMNSKFDAPKVKKAGFGTWYLSYQQTYQGLPVYGGSVDLIIQNQKLTVMCSDFYPGIGVSAVPKISKEQAAATAGQGLSKGTLIPISSQLIIFPKQIANDTVCYYTAWKLIMPVLHLPQRQIENHPAKTIKKGMIPVQWCFFIDAATGNIIERTNLMKDSDLSGNVQGMIYPQNPTDTQQLVKIIHMNLKLTKDASVYNQETDVTNGHYLFTGLSDGNATLEAHFTGAHVAVHNNETPDPDATHSATVTIPGTHDWNWTTDDPSPNDVETNAFYHVNNIRDWYLRGDPFNVSPAEDPLNVYVRDGAYQNAYYSSGSGLYFCSDSPGECPDFALCADIIYHEFTHAIVDKSYTGTPLPYSGQTGAMDEGWADYFACTITNDPHEGEGAFPPGRNLDTPDQHYPENWYGEVHADSPIFSGAIWDTRAALGLDYTDSLALRALKKKTTSFNSYLGAILEEDDNPAYSPDPSANGDPTDGTPNIDVISHCFYDLHGIYYKYSIGHTEKPIAVILSPEPTQFNVFNSSVTSIDITGTANRSKLNPMANFTVEYANAATPGAWLTAGVTLTGGGTAPITEAILATLNISGISDGKYLIRLTVTDTGSVVNSATTQIIIDRLLVAGWPQNLSEYFDFPVAVGDIDPSTPGLEVVAVTLFSVYVYHADGSLYAPWPKDISDYIQSAPVVADLDNDGEQEIIVSAWNHLYVWRHDGTSVFTTNYGGYGNYDYIFPSPVVTDLDNDGDLEIIAATTNGKVHIVHHNGTAFASAGFTWPKTAGAGIYSTPALADIDSDLQKEIVFGCSDGKVYAWKLNGANVAGSWPVTIGQPVPSSPAIGDIDNDPSHDFEIVVGANDGKVYAWHHDGSSVAGSWPVTIPASSYYGIMTSPALADLDHNGDLEVIINGATAGLKALEHDGSNVTPWSSPSTAAFFANSPVAGDLDGDEIPEIIAGSYNSKLYAFHPNGTAVTDFPRETAAGFYFGAPLITDLNQDGHPEIIAGSQGLYIWTLPGSYNKSAQNWPAFHHDGRCTGYYESDDPGIILLFDTSGSMSWKPDSSHAASPDEQRIAIVREAAYPFLEMLNDFNSGNANFGIATFPAHPAAFPYPATAQVVTPLTLVTDTSKNQAITATIPGLITEDNTPLLTGMNTAINMFGLENRKTIVLLSDGYHNNPSLVSVGDPAVTTLVNRLNANSIRVFTIGFGCPTDVDHPLLETLASSTTPAGFVGSQFYDVTTAGFHLPWDPANELKQTYKNILKDALGLDSPVDPLGEITAAQKVTVEVKINNFDRQICFFISWSAPVPNKLKLTVLASDGQPVPVNAVGVKYHQGKTYQIIAVNQTFLKQAGKVNATPWKMIIDPVGVSGNNTEKYQYSVLVDSNLKMKLGLNRTSYQTGDSIIITAKITEAGHPITGLKAVTLTATRPDNGLGNWYTLNKVSDADLRSIPTKRGETNLSPLQRKAVFLNSVRKISYPGRVAPVKIPLYDDSTHGDQKAGDGIYTTTYSDLVKEGTYAFHIRVSGVTKDNTPFDREGSVQKYVSVKVSPEHSLVKIISLNQIVGKYRTYKMVITPKDALGNFLGPRYAGTIKMSIPQGRLVGPVLDNLDGTYTQMVQLIPSLVNKKTLQLDLNVNKTRIPTSRIFNP